LLKVEGHNISEEVLEPPDMHLDRTLLDPARSEYMTESDGAGVLFE
jgi:hypothetical protein